MAVRPIDSAWLKRNLNKVFPRECDQLYGMLQLIDESPTLTPPNEPMTLEQLREMEDPVWCVCKTVEGFEGFWCLCDHGYILTPARQIFDVKEIPHWVFYRRPPEGEEAGNG